MGLPESSDFGVTFRQIRAPILQALTATACRRFLADWEPMRMKKVNFRKSRNCHPRRGVADAMYPSGQSHVSNGSPVNTFRYNFCEASALACPPPTCARARTVCHLNLVDYTVGRLGRQATQANRSVANLPRQAPYSSRVIPQAVRFLRPGVRLKFRPQN
jgi:hypothetical protein